MTVDHASEYTSLLGMCSKDNNDVCDTIIMTSHYYSKGERRKRLSGLSKSQILRGIILSEDQKIEDETLEVTLMNDFNEIEYKYIDKTNSKTSERKATSQV